MYTENQLPTYPGSVVKSDRQSGGRFGLWLCFVVCGLHRKIRPTQLELSWMWQKSVCCRTEAVRAYFLFSLCSVQSTIIPLLGGLGLGVNLLHEMLISDLV